MIKTNKISKKILTKQEILKHLRLNSRISLTNLSKKTNIPISTLYDKIKEYSHEFIKKYTVILNHNNLGYNTHALIKIKIEKEKLEEFKTHLKNNPLINSVYLIDDFSFFIEIITKDNNDLYNWINQINIKFNYPNTKINFIFEEFKQEEFLPINYYNY